MNCLRQVRWWPALCAAVQLAVFPLSAENPTNTPAPIKIFSVPPARSPVDLFRQLLAIRPKAICVLGGTAAKALLGTREGITKLRGNWQNWHDIQVMPTYHPSFLLRPYSQNAKRESWEDLKKVLHYVFD